MRLENAAKNLDAAMHKGSIRVRPEIAENLIRGAKNEVALARRSILTEREPDG